MALMFGFRHPRIIDEHHPLDARRQMASRTEQLPDLNYLAGDSLARLERYEEAERLFADTLRTTNRQLRDLATDPASALVWQGERCNGAQHRHPNDRTHRTAPTHRPPPPRR